MAWAMLFCGFIMPAASNCSAQSAAGQQITIPFAPPLGKDIVYRVTNSKTYRGQSKTGPTYNFKLRFERNGPDGYVLSVAVIANNGGQPLSPAQQLLEMPISYDLAPSGRVVQVHDWDHEKLEMIRTYRAIIDSTEPDPAKRPAMLAMVTGFTTLSAREAVPHMLAWLDPVLGFGGTRWPAGAAQKTSTEMRGGVMIVPLPADATTTVTDKAAGNVELSRESVLNRQTAGAVATRGAARVAAEQHVSGGQAEGMISTAAHVAAQPTVDRLTLLLNRSSGIPVHATYIRKTTFQDVGEVETASEIDLVQ